VKGNPLDDPKCHFQKFFATARKENSVAAITVAYLIYQELAAAGYKNSRS
jgi:hypothetical protein